MWPTGTSTLNYKNSLSLQIALKRFLRLIFFIVFLFLFPLLLFRSFLHFSYSSPSLLFTYLLAFIFRLLLFLFFLDNFSILIALFSFSLLILLSLLLLYSSFSTNPLAVRRSGWRRSWRGSEEEKPRILCALSRLLCMRCERECLCREWHAARIFLPHLLCRKTPNWWKCAS